MFCSRCGAENPEYAVKCEKCGNAFEGRAAPTGPGGFGGPGPSGPSGPGNLAPPAYRPPPAPIPNYLVPAILTTLFCCLPFGIVSIVYASQVNSKLAQGDESGALASSASAKGWAWASFGVGLGLGILMILVNLAGMSHRY